MDFPKTSNKWQNHRFPNPCITSQYTLAQMRSFRDKSSTQTQQICLISHTTNVGKRFTQTSSPQVSNHMQHTFAPSQRGTTNSTLQDSRKSHRKIPFSWHLQEWKLPAKHASPQAKATWQWALFTSCSNHSLPHAACHPNPSYLLVPLLSNHASLGNTTWV